MDYHLFVEEALNECSGNTVLENLRNISIVHIYGFIGGEIEA